MTAGQFFNIVAYSIDKANYENERRKRNGRSD